MRSTIIALALLLSPALALADGEGQADLDKAMELKLSAESLNDLGEVINLCRSALAAGLDDTNKEFASKMLLGTLMQRSEVICAQVFDDPQPPPQWPILRRQALLDLEEAVKVDGDVFDVHYMIGRLQALPGGDRERASKALDAAIKLAADSPRDQAKSLVLRGNIAQDQVKRRADYDEAVKLAPKDAEIVRTRGLFHLIEKRPDEALADFDKAIELDPENADTQEARGVALFVKEKYDDAMAAFDKAIELEPKSPMAHVHRARVYAMKDDNQRGIEQLDEALKIDPKLVIAFVLRAQLHRQSGDKDKATADVNEALSIAPGDTQALQMRALLAGEGKFNDAITDLQQLRRAEPDNVELLMQLGMFYSADKQTRKAIEIYAAVLKKDPENVQALRNRGDAWLGIGKLEDAIKDYEAALKLDPKDSGVLNNLAWLLGTAPVDNLRDGKRAVDLAKEACRVTDFKQAHILSTLAAAYAETGDFDSAKSWSKKAVELSQQDAEQSDPLDQLKAELSSYEAGKPWREKVVTEPESNDPEPEDSADPLKQPEPNSNAGGTK